MYLSFNHVLVLIQVIFQQTTNYHLKVYTYQYGASVQIKY